MKILRFCGAVIGVMHIMNKQKHLLQERAVQGDRNGHFQSALAVGLGPISVSFHLRRFVSQHLSISLKIDAFIEAIQANSIDLGRGGVNRGIPWEGVYMTAFPIVLTVSGALKASGKHEDQFPSADCPGGFCKGSNTEWGSLMFGEL